MKKITAVLLMVVMTLSLTATVFAGSGITKKEAIKIALDDANTTRTGVKRFEAEKDHGKFEIEFVKKSTGSEFDYEISKKGIILEKSVDLKYKKNPSKEKVGKEAARKAVSDHSGISMKVIKKGTCRYEYEKHEGTYEVKFRSGKYKYDYEVLAPTGKVIEYDKKYVR